MTDDQYNTIPSIRSTVFAKSPRLKDNAVHEHEGQRTIRMGTIFSIINY